MAKILLVDDDLFLCKTVSVLLKHDNHIVESVHNANEAMNRIEFEHYDLIILDWDLPDMEGVEILKKYRHSGGMKPVLMLTGKNATENKVISLDAGADDYISKPFDDLEFLARVRALARRQPITQVTRLRYNNIELDPANDAVFIDGEEKEFYPKEFALLKLFISNQGSKFSPQTILERLWSSESETTANSIKTYLARLRQRLNNYGARIEIKNTKKVGYFVDKEE